MEVKSEDEFELTSGGFVDFLPETHFSLKPAFDYADNDFRLKNDFLPSTPQSEPPIFLLLLKGNVTSISK